MNLSTSRPIACCCIELPVGELSSCSTLTCNMDGELAVLVQFAVRCESRSANLRTSLHSGQVSSKLRNNSDNGMRMDYGNASSIACTGEDLSHRKPLYARNTHQVMTGQHFNRSTWDVLAMLT